MIRVGHIEVFARDPLGEARRFYEQVLGFEVVAVQGDNVWLKLGEVEVLLRPAVGEVVPATAYDGARAGIVLYTADLPGEMARLVARGLRFDGADGSDKCPTFRDPDGHWFQLVDPNDH